MEAQPPERRSSAGFFLAALFGGVVLLVAGALGIEELANRDDSDRVVQLRDLPAFRSGGEPHPTRATMTPDGALWMTCRYDLLCGLASDGAWLGSVELPFVAWSATAPRDGPTHGLAGDRHGRLYVSHGHELLEVSLAEQRIRARLSVLPDKEEARCLAVAADDTLWVVTSRNDIVQLDANRSLRARWQQPLTGVDARHHGCNSIAVDARGQVHVTPEDAPAIYVFAPTGQLVRRHAPGGTGNYAGLVPLSNDKLVVGYYDQLVVFDASFRTLTGPKVRRDRWAWVTGAVQSQDGALVVVTRLGFVARWERAEQRW